MAEVLVGAAKLEAKLRQLGAAAIKEGGRALYQEALVEQKESMRRTPVDTGALKGSHETSKPEQGGGDVSVTITVGGPAAPYAVPVHENLHAFHKVGQAKFLESTILESRSSMAERIARRIDLNAAARGAA
jgi:hypothetical protein